MPPRRIVAGLSEPIMDRAILHIDMDAFFASVEVLDHPDLRGKPVIVGGLPENRGVVAAASYEARRFGIHSAMSSYRARKLCPQAIFIAPRGRRYKEASDRIFAILHEYTPLVEPLSIDEAFLDVTGSRRLFGPPESIGRQVKARIREETGLTASVGVAMNKFLAKLASDLEKPDGFVVIRPDELPERLNALPVSRLWGVGKVTQSVLEGMGIRTIGDLLTHPEESLDYRFGVANAQALRQLARGEDERPVIPFTEAKSVGAENTFATDIHERERLVEQLDRLADKAAHRLRAKGLVGQTVNLKARYADFTTVTRANKLPRPTASTLTIREAARELFDHRLDRQGRALRLLGVSISNLERAGTGQAELFIDERQIRSEKLDQLLDRIQNKYGSESIGLGRPYKKD